MLYRVKFLPYILVALFASLFFFVSFLHTAHALTYVSGDINTDTTWTLSGSPYILDNTLFVFEDATLSIEPGVEVKFYSYFSVPKTIYVYGKILAVGTEANPIIFTSNNDDTYSNTDDNGYCDFLEYDEEGNGTGEEVCEYFDLDDPEVGDWRGFYFSDSTGSIFENVNIRYAKEIANLSNSSISIKNANLFFAEKGITAFNDSSISAENLFFDEVKRDIIVLFNDSFLNFKNIKIRNILMDPITIFNRSSFTGEGFDIEDNYFNFRSDTVTLFNSSNLILKNSSFKSCGGSSCIVFFDGLDYLSEPTLVEIENTIFEFGSGPALLTFADSAISATIKNSVFSGFETYAIESYAPNFTINASNNYWGDPSGPNEPNLNPTGKGEEIYGKVSFTPWCKTRDCIFRNPIIIIPGVLGNDILRTAEDDEDEPQKLWLNITKMITDIGDEFMDDLGLNDDFTPVKDGLIIGEVIKKELASVFAFDYTEGLINELKTQGYTEGTDIFTFPYDWRYGVSDENINKLKNKITEVLEITGGNKVDILAHSTGGLLTKKYVIENPETHSIDKAVFVGVPSSGAPQAIKMLLQGANIGIEFLEPDEMKKIAKNLPVVYDLSPSLEYYNKKGSYIEVQQSRPFKKKIKTDLSFDEANALLLERNLNELALTGAHELHTSDFDNYDMRTAGVDLYNIVGCRAGTTGKIIEQRSILNKISYGYPELIPGDGTVPLESATNLPVDQNKKYFALNANHSKMPSQSGIRELITNIFSNSSLPTGNKITQDITKCKLNGRAIAVYSPVSIEVFDQFGSRIGLFEDGVNIQNDISNSFFEISDGHKYLYLPTDEAQVYTINIKGTGEGTFTITDTVINEGEKKQMQVFKDIPATLNLSGKILLGENTELVLDNDGDGSVDETLTPNLVLDETELLEFDPYFVEAKEEVSSSSAGNSFGGSFGGGLPVFVSQIAENILPEVNIENTLSSDTNSIIKTPVLPIQNGEVLGENIINQSIENKEEIIQPNITPENQQIPETKNSKPNFIVLISLGFALVILLAKFFIKL